MLIAQQSLPDNPLPLRRTPPRPRDYWIFDQVVRRGRREADVAEDLCLSQARISQICKEVGAWYSRVHDECLPEVAEARLRVVAYLLNVRLAAQRKGLVPRDEDTSAVIRRLLCEFAGLGEKSQELIGY